MGLGGTALVFGLAKLWLEFTQLRGRKVKERSANHPSTEATAPSEWVYHPPPKP